MLEYYKLMLVKAGEDTLAFKKELRRALRELDDPEEIASLRFWFKNRLSLPNQEGTTS